MRIVQLPSKGHRCPSPSTPSPFKVSAAGGSAPSSTSSAPPPHCLPGAAPQAQQARNYRVRIAQLPSKRHRCPSPSTPSPFKVSVGASAASNPRALPGWCSACPPPGRPARAGRRERCPGCALTASGHTRHTAAATAMTDTAATPPASPSSSPYLLSPHAGTMRCAKTPC